MCGIGALLDPDGPADARVERAMLDALRHRGPDGEGARREGPALLVHTRLAIIDVAGGDQPLVSEDGEVVLVANGEIYNHLELRAELQSRGHRFATGSDCEVILHLYEELGPECVRRLNGIFGFVLWDRRRRTLVAARDPLGVKPLYWAQRGRRIAVASEVSALLAVGLGSVEIDSVALDHFLAWRFVPAPRTMFAGVSKLAAASVLVADERGRVSVSSYREAPGEPFADRSVAQLQEEFVGRFEDAVARQMMSDVPYGAFLSAGIDSAAIAASMRNAGADPLRTFTVGFPGEGDELDERAGAAETAAALGAEHRDLGLTATDFERQLRRSIRRLEEPCGIPSAPALLALSEFTSRSVKVVLSGQGADEPLGGYPRHQAAALLRIVASLPSAVGAPARAATSLLPRNERARRAARLFDAGDDLDRLLQIFEIAPAGTRRALTGADDTGAQERRALAAGVLEDVRGRDVLEQALYLDTHLFLPDGLLVYGDKMTMAHGLEQRVPFLDVEFMRFVERIPARLRVRGLRRKWLYRGAIRRVVPPVAADRPKLGFSTPYDRWLRASLGEQVERRYTSDPELSAVLEGATVSTLVAAHRAARDDNKRVLYCLLELAMWKSAFGDPGDADAEAAAA